MILEESKVKIWKWEYITYYNECVINTYDGQVGVLVGEPFLGVPHSAYEMFTLLGKKNKI